MLGQLPQSSEENRYPFILPSNYKRTAIISDIHIPYHSVKSNEIILNKLISLNPDSIVINGDFLDFYQLSKFMKDPRKRSVADELEAGRQYLDLLAMNFPDARIFYKLGNHDERYENYLKNKAPELLNIPDFSLDILLRLGEKRIEYITDKRAIEIGGLTVVHGHEMNINSVNVNPARTLFLKAKVSALCSHLHVASQHSAKRMDKHVVTCWSIGHMGEESPLFAPFNEWIWGFAVVDHESMEFEVSNYKVIDNKVYRT